jgi:N-acetylglucosaminyldiphosphoundecaprenol N-acetyl-beta-D-mannosaminyltransferase
VKPATFTLLGCRIDAFGLNSAVKAILQTIDDRYTGAGKPAFVVTIGTEMIVRAQENEIFRLVLNQATFSLCDTIGVLLASRLRGGPLRQRVTGVALAERLCELLAKRNESVFFFGAKGDTAEAAAIGMKIKFPNLQIAGYRDGYFSPGESGAIAAEIRASGATMLLVALGSPKQEEWIVKHLAATGCAVAIGVGGAFDVFSGRTKRAPHFWQVSGLEWLYRLISEPHRWRRQLALPKFAYLAVREMVSAKIPRSN